MTMPDSVMAWKPKNSRTWIYNPDPDWLDRQSQDEINTMRMIRADIAEELARAAAEVTSEYDNPDNGRSLRWAVDELRQALARYRAITIDTHASSV